MLETILPLALFSPRVSDGVSEKDGSKMEPLPVVPTTDITSLVDLKSQMVNEVEEVLPLASRFDINATHIQSSPYSDPLNHLDLRDLEKPFRLFALALTQRQATRPDYATAPYMASFNWDEVFETLRELCAETGTTWRKLDFYVVIFRSQLREGADRARLGELDQMSHQEACASGGLLNYWFGSPNGDRRNLATCIWRNSEDAVAGGRGPWHKKARGAAREMYDTITFERKTLRVEDGAASWSLIDGEA